MILICLIISIHSFDYDYLYDFLLILMHKANIFILLSIFHSQMDNLLKLTFYLLFHKNLIKKNIIFLLVNLINSNLTYLKVKKSTLFY